MRRRVEYFVLSNPLSIFARLSCILMKHLIAFSVEKGMCVRHALLQKEKKELQNEGGIE